MNGARLANALCLAASLLAMLVGATFAATATPPVAAPAPAVSPQALDALSRMSAYLRTLQSFTARSDTVREESCGGVYYQPQYQGTSITYVVVDQPH